MNFKNQLWDLQPSCKQEIQKRYKTNKAAVNKTGAEPILMVINMCEYESVTNPFNGDEWLKADMALLLVFVDMLVVVLFLIYI